MVIDLTRRPVFINTDICASDIVIRTASSAEVDGKLHRKLEPKERRRPPHEILVSKLTIEVVPEVEIPRKGITFMECRLPLSHISDRRESDPLPNPFEVATYFRNSFTNKAGTWRASIIVEKAQNANGSFWCITVRDESQEMDLVTATVKVLDEARLPGLQPEPLPLQRMRPEKEVDGRQSVWDRLRFNRDV